MSALKVKTPGGGFEDAPPVAWQEIGGERVMVEAAFALTDKADENGHGFRVGHYDCTRPLILDPAVLVYCGYIGGAVADNGYGIAVDAAGNVYVTGSAESDQQTFPVTVGSDVTYNGS